MVARLGNALNRFSARWVPDPFVLAILLTALVLCAGAGRMMGLGESGIAESLALGWMDGFALSGGLAFALQMCFVLVTGHAMALSPPVQRAIVRIARVPQNAASASAMVALVACLSALLHWGLGAIAGALLAREIGRHAPARGLEIHYPLLGAAAYAGMAVWHGGLSGSAPLKVAGGDGAQWVGEVSLSELLLSPANLVVTSSPVVFIPLLFWALTPKQPSAMVSADPARLGPLPEYEVATVDSPVAWLQESHWPGRFIGVLGIGMVGVAIFSGARKLEINSVNMLFFFAGLLLQGSLRRYTEAVTDGARGAGAIILQFPLYFGILGVMKISGMIGWLSESMASWSTPSSFPILSFLSAGVTNLFVPSGGGQWGVQRDILLSSGQSLGVDPTSTIMAFSYGDAWTNMLQPFWALPLLGIMGLKAKDIIGYTAMVFLLMLVVVPIGLLLT
ncbi:MAG: short-chain fatty acid transporter [Myxococcales bacterium]|nr:short-chain fatty acid transporter [Myxococcales bacterium]